MNLLDTLRAESDLGGEELNALRLVERRVNVGRLSDGLTLEGLEEGASEAGTGLSHGEGGRTSTILSLDDLITTKLDAVGKGIEGLARDIGVRRLGDQGDNGVTRVATNNGDGLGGRVSVLNLRNESGRTDNIKGGNTKDSLGVVNTLGLENLSNNGDGRVDGVGNDGDESLGGSLGNSLGQVTDNGGVGVEEIVTGHTGLSGDTGGDDNNLDALKSLLKTLVIGEEALDNRVGGDVGKVGSDTGGTSKIVKRKGGNVLVELKEKGEGLADTTGGTENGNLVGLRKKS